LYCLSSDFFWSLYCLSSDFFWSLYCLSSDFRLLIYPFGIFKLFFISCFYY
jgi:hypothetical protein